MKKLSKIKKLSKKDFMTVNQMIDYAAERHPKLKETLLREKKSNSNSCYQSIYQKIRRTLEEYQEYGISSKRESDFEENELLKNNLSDVSIKKDNSKEAYYIPIPYARYIIDEIMQKYLINAHGDIDKKSKEMMESKITKQLKEQMEIQIMKRTKKPTEKEFAKMDKQINDLCNKSVAETDWEKFYDYSSDETEKTGDNEYHIPRVAVDDYSIDFENRVLCKMLCSFINLNEEEFRANFRKQTKHINKITFSYDSPAFKDGVFDKMLFSFVGKDSYGNLMEQKKHIKEITLDYYSSAFENEVICKMLCAFVKSLYDFQEDEFRKDLDERSNHISDCVISPYSSGYSALTWKLEHFVCNYIFPQGTINRRNLNNMSATES